MDEQALVNGVEIDTSKENPIILDKEDIEHFLDWRKSIKDHFNCYVQIKCINCGKTVVKNTPRKSSKYCSIKFLSFCKACSIRNTAIEKYGVENVFQLESVKSKLKETCLIKYGETSYKKTEESKQRFQDYSIQRYGTINPFQAEEVKEKIYKTCINKFGTKSPLQNKEIKEKQALTNFERYGVYHVLQSKDILQKQQKTMLDKYGCINAMHNDDFKKKCLEHTLSTFSKNTFQFENIKFDSSWELYFYLYYKYKGVDIIRNTEVFIDYKDSQGMNHKYIPDFLINGEIYEVKGEQFIERDNHNNVCNLKNPYEPQKNYISESKYKCMVQNKVNIITVTEMISIIDFIDDIYGTEYVYLFKKD